QEAVEALRLTKAVRLNLTVASAELNEPVVFSPYVWGTKQLSLARFLAGLPPNERDALLGMSEQVLSTPGLHMSRLAASPTIIRGGRVGPATNLGTGYPRLEAAGVVAVEPYGDRAYLRLVKPEIAKSGLDWIGRITDPSGTGEITLSQRPAKFVKPEDARGDD